MKLRVVGEKQATLSLSARVSTGCCEIRLAGFPVLGWRPEWEVRWERLSPNSVATRCGWPIGTAAIRTYRLLAPQQSERGSVEPDLALAGAQFADQLFFFTTGLHFEIVGQRGPGQIARELVGPFLARDANARAVALLDLVGQRRHLGHARQRLESITPLFQ